MHLGVVDLVDRILRADSQMVQSIRHDANRTLRNADLRDDQIARVGLEERSLVAAFLLRTPNKQLAPEADLGDDVQAVERASGLVDRRHFPRNELAERPLSECTRVTPVILFDPALYLPPPPDQAVEGTGKFGVASGCAPQASQAWNSR